MSNCEVVTFPLVSWVRCGAWLYRFLVFALFITSRCRRTLLQCVSSIWSLQPFLLLVLDYNWASACDFQQFDILTSVDSDEPVQPPFKLRNSKWRSVSSLTIIVYSSDKQRLWSDCAYAQAGLRLCWSHIPNCWKSHALAQLISVLE